MSTRGVKFQFSVGEHVLCFEPDPLKARVLYEAKILELIPSPARGGIRIPEYHVHFQGWNNSWDRIVNETFILSDTEFHRGLMRRIADMAHKYRNNRKRIEKIDDILRRAQVRKPMFGDVETEPMGNGTSTPVSEVESDSIDSAIDVDKDIAEIEDQQDIGPMRSVNIDLPEELKDVLNDDYFLVRQNRLVKLPCSINVVNILEAYVAYFATTNSQSDVAANNQESLEICREMVVGVRVIFDFLLPLILLYDEEREQFNDVRSTFVYKNPRFTTTPSSTPPVIKKEFTTSDPKSMTYPISRKCQKNDEAASKKLTVFESPLKGYKQNMLQNIRVRRCSRRTNSDPAAFQPEESPGLCNLSPLPIDSATIHDVMSTSLPSRTNKPGRGRRKSFGFSHKKTHKAFQRKLNLDNNVPSVNDLGLLSSPSVKSPSSSIHNVFFPFDDATATNQLEMASNKGSMVLGKQWRSRQNTPSPPLLLPSSKPSTTVDESEQQQTKQFWALLSADLLHRHPALPCVIYGSQHLLRLFVKLPDCLSKLRMQESKLTLLLSHIHLFLRYLVMEKERLFSEASYCPST